MADRRVGIGHDVHRLAAGRRLTLGGVEIAALKGFDTPSDGDVLCHALIDALAGALVEGDLGAMRANVAAALSAPVERVSVKARTNDGLGPEGAGDAASATCVVLLGRA